MTSSKRSVRIIVLALLVVAFVSTVAADCEGGPPVIGRIMAIQMERDGTASVVVTWPNESQSVFKDHEISGKVRIGACVAMDILNTSIVDCP